MSTSLVLTVIGDDRPGLVELLATAIADHEGNWLESRMARLEGKFAGIVSVELPEGRVDALTEALSGLGAKGLQVAIQVTEEREGDRTPVHLELIGTDHLGIVRDVTTVLARLQVNVEELFTEVTEAPHSSQELFHAILELHLPADLGVEQLAAELETVTADLMVDIQLGEGDED